MVVPHSVLLKCMRNSVVPTSPWNDKEKKTNGARESKGGISVQVGASSSGPPFLLSLPPSKRPSFDLCLYISLSLSLFLLQLPLSPIADRSWDVPRQGSSLLHLSGFQRTEV